MDNPEHEQTTEEAKNKYIELFNEYDTDKNGSLCFEEFKAMLENNGYVITLENMKSYFSQMDIDGDDTVSVGEFIQYMTGIPMVDHRRAMWRKAFLAWDVNHSGDIDREELRQVFRDVAHREMTIEEVDRVFKWMDKDQDGRIEWEEFVSYFLNMSKNFVD